MRYLNVVLLTMLVLSFTATSWAVEQNPYHPPILTQDQARVLYPWAFGIKTVRVSVNQKLPVGRGSGLTTNKIPMDKEVPVGFARNLPDDGQDKTLEAWRHGNLPPISDQWGMDDLSRSSRGHEDWATDVLVRTGSLPTFGRLSMDHSAGGHLFIALYDPANAPNDTIFHYVSANNGRTWTPWLPIVGDPAGGRVSDVEVRVGDETPNPNIYTFVLYQAGSNSGLWCRRLAEDGTNLAWTMVASGGDTISQVSGDRDNAPPYYLYTTFQGNGGNLYGIRSVDNNVTWDTRTYISSVANTHSEMAMGGGGNFYVTYQVDTTTIRIGRNDGYLGGTWVFNSIVGQGVSEWWPSVAASRTQAPASQSAWVIFRNNHGGTAIDTHYGTSTDGGATWAATFWPPTNDYASPTPNYPHIRVSYDYSTADLNSVVVPIYIAAFDSIVFAWSSAADPTNWQARQIINDWGNTGEFGPKVDITDGTGGSTVTYRQYGSDRVWFDWWWNNVGVEKGGSVSLPNGLSLASARPNPLTRSTSIAFSLPKSGNVDLAVYDIAGRKVATLAQGTMSAGNHEVSWNGAKAPAGVYLYRLSFEGKALTNRMVVVR